MRIVLVQDILLSDEAGRGCERMSVGKTRAVKPERVGLTG